MAGASHTTTTVSAFNRIPDFARGLVRDLRVRWALEEIGRPYCTELLDATRPRSGSYRKWQPFGQVPAFDDGNVRLFESGAIVLYLAEQNERLLPCPPRARWEATAWLFAALNSIEPALMPIVHLDLFHAGEEWAGRARPAAVEHAESRLQSLSDALGEKAWLAGRFSVADIMMVTVLRIVKHIDIVAGFDNLANYRKRGEERPAFTRAHEAQCADFAPDPPEGERR